MNQFYVSIVFLGILLVVISLVWIVYDRKKSYDYTNLLDGKKAELAGIINDAEQMVEELNRFSDYIVTQMDLKNEELCNNLKCIDEKVKQISATVRENLDIKTFQVDKAVNSGSVDFNMKSELPKHNSDLIIENLNYDNPSVVYNQNQGYKTYAKTKEKVIPLNSKYKEVVSLAQNGLGDTEIAKRLNMGKGEIQLILEMHK